jgi:hypothetical protein
MAELISASVILPSISVKHFIFEMLHDKDPKQYWKLIEELKDTEKIDTTSSISTSTWQSHFQNLNNPKTIYNNDP